MKESESLTGPVQYILDNFWIDHNNEVIYIDFHSELRSACDLERKLSLLEFQYYLVKEQRDYLSDYIIPDAEEHEEKIFWFEALENVKNWHVEGFLNQQIKIGTCHI